ncbi:MAG: polysaccharide deacetylase family protein [Rhodospirillaceae bacterium]
MPKLHPKDGIAFDPADAPQLIVFVDAEEEFQWHTFSSAAVSVRNMAVQSLAQDIMNEFGVKPTYLVDYAVAAQEEGFLPLRGMLDAGMCTVGAQLHPWVNPPLDELLTRRNTYHGNLPAGLERAKIECLTATITANFGVRPTVFKAGRYGAGPNTPAALMACGYQVDASVMPLADFSPDGGPDYSQSPTVPYWIDPACRLLEIPNTVGLVGLMEGVDRRSMHTLLGGTSTHLRIPGLLARLGFLERIRLTPEGISLDEARRLTMSLFQRGHRLFVLSYHSSSLLPGGAPYVTTQADLDAFLAWLRGYLRFFFGPLSGRATTADDVFRMARGQIVSRESVAPAHAVA